MTNIEESGLIEATTEEVWNFVTEPDNFPEYIYKYLEGNVLSDNKTGLNSEFEWFTKFFGRRWRSVEKVTEWNENQKVAYHGTLAGAEFWSQMKFKDVDSQTDLTIIIEYSMPYSILGWLLDVLYFRRRVRKEVKHSISQIKSKF